MTYQSEEKKPFLKPSRYASASEWLANGWEWRDRAWWKYDEDSRTWHKVKGTAAQPYEDVIKPHQEPQG